MCTHAHENDSHLKHFQIVLVYKNIISLLEVKNEVKQTETPKGKKHPISKLALPKRTVHLISTIEIERET